MKRGHVPLRTCLGCSGRFPKADLLRIALDRGSLVVGTGPGRGCYVCRKSGCIGRALGSRALSRLAGRPPGEREAERLRRLLLDMVASPTGRTAPESEERR